MLLLERPSSILFRSGNPSFGPAYIDPRVDEDRLLHLMVLTGMYPEYRTPHFNMSHRDVFGMPGYCISER